MIDPDGEVIFLLEDANAPFAVWDEEKSRPPKKPVKNQLRRKSNWAIQRFLVDQIVQIRKRSSVTDRKKGAYSHTGSAKHLMLASPVMKNTPSGGWKESDVFAKKGSIDLVIHDWIWTHFYFSCESFTVNIRICPAKLLLKCSLRFLYWQTTTRVRIPSPFFANLWIDQLKSDFPTRHSRDLVMWMFVSWYFNKQEEYEIFKSIAMTQSNAAPITNLDLPLPITELGKLLRSNSLSPFRVSNTPPR